MKTLNELTLLDKFLFDEVMDIPEAHEAALRIILGDEKLRLLTPSQSDKAPLHGSALSGWTCTPLMKIFGSTTPKLRKPKSLICHVEVASIRVLWTRLC